MLSGFPHILTMHRAGMDLLPDLVHGLEVAQNNSEKEELFHLLIACKNQELPAAVPRMALRIRPSLRVLLSVSWLIQEHFVFTEAREHCSTSKAWTS